MARPPPSPFTPETAIPEVRLTADAWSGRDRVRVAPAYPTESRWRSRSTFRQGRTEIEAFVTPQWQRERDCRLIVAQSRRLYRWLARRRPDCRAGRTGLGL